MTTPRTTERPLRADAQRNRDRIVDAARATFAAQGLAAQMEDVARNAGVGVGTVYRHFATKDALVRALIERKMALMATYALERLDEPPEDAWEEFRSFTRQCAEEQAHDRALSQVLATQPAETFLGTARETGLFDATGRLLARAQEQGTARADLGPEDVGAMMCGLGAVAQAFGPDQGLRYLETMLAGMRSPGVEAA
jgi:AcrR family transcriptional regulator